MRFKEFMTESINDKHILKAVFVVGIPGAGKSYTVKKLTGSVAPRIVNTDRATEYLAREFGGTINKDNWPQFSDTAHRLTSNSLSNYINSMLPLFIDGTSNNLSNILHRAGILESLGYDIGMVYINTPLKTALKRAKERAASAKRDVDEDFIIKVHTQSEENREYFKSKFDFFKEINNDDDELTDTIMLKAYKQVTGFFESPNNNPVGTRLIEKLKKEKGNYLVPTIITKEILDKKIQGWYRT